MTTLFINNANWQEIAEYSWTAGFQPALVQSYVFGNYIDEALVMVKEDGAKYYYQANDIYSVYALTDAMANVVERYAYDPYGKVTISNANSQNTRNKSFFGNSWTFTGRRLDQETGLIHYRSRMYTPYLARYTERDPLWDMENLIGVGIDNYFASSEVSSAKGFGKASYWQFDPVLSPRGQGIYEYVGGNPLSTTDATGLTQGLKVNRIRTPSVKPTPRSTGKCGAFDSDFVAWELFENAPNGGYIIQEISIHVDAIWCDHSKTTDPSCVKTRGLGPGGYLYYWEAWKVSPNQRNTDSFAGLKYDDHYWWRGCGKCTKGKYTATGRSRFYDVRSLPDTFKVSNGATWAGILPSTTIDPKLSNGIGEGWHSVIVSWDCCPNIERNTNIILFKP